MRTWTAALLVWTGCALQGDGAVVFAVRVVPWFEAIEVFDGFEVTARVRPGAAIGPGVTLRLSGEANALGRLLTEVHGVGRLSVAVDPNVQTALTVAPTLSFEVRALREVYASDQAVVRVAGARGGLAIAAEGASIIEATELRAVSAEVRARDASYVLLAGTGESITISAAEGAIVDASALAVARAAVTVEDVNASVTVCTTAEPPKIVGRPAQVRVRCDR